MAINIITSPKFTLSSIRLFISSYILKLADLSPTLTNRNYYTKLVQLLKGYNEIILDKTGTILTWNKEFEKINGFRFEEILGQRLNCFYVPMELSSKRMENLLEQAKQYGTAIDVGHFVRKDGSTFWGSLKVVAIKKDKTLLGYTVVPHLALNLN